MISLARSTDRRIRFDKQAKEHKIDYIYLDATDARNREMMRSMPLMTDIGICTSMDGQLLCPEEVGCNHSHHRAWREVLQNDAPGAIILEDDVRFLDNCKLVICFIKLISEEWRNRNAVIYLTSGHCGDWIGTHVLGRNSAISIPTGGRFMRIRRMRGVLWGNSGYFITNAAARCLLEREEMFTRLPDAWYERFTEGSLSELWLTDPPCMFHPQDDKNSLLHEGRRRRAAIGEDLQQVHAFSLRSKVFHLARGAFNRIVLDPIFRKWG